MAVDEQDDRAPVSGPVEVSAPATGDPQVDDVLQRFDAATRGPLSVTTGLTAVAEAHQRLHARLSDPS